VSQSSRFQKC